MKSIIIAGVGNVLLGDDGIGPYVAALLKARYQFGEEVQIEDLGTPALDLIDYISGRDVFILIDSVQNGEAAGTVTLYSREDILRHPAGMRMDPHSPALGESLLTAELMGSAPGEVILIGVTGQSFEPSCELTGPVHAAVGRVVGVILERLRQFGVDVRPGSNDSAEQAWWTEIPAEQPALQ